VRSLAAVAVAAPPPLLSPRRLQAEHHYTLQPQLLGYSALRDLVERFADVLVVRGAAAGRLRLHPSPVFHLRRLVAELLQPSDDARGGAAAAPGTYPGYPGYSGGRANGGGDPVLSPMQVTDAFEARFGYVMPVRQLGFRTLAEVLQQLQSDCTVTGDGAGYKYQVTAPAAGARNSFNQVSALVTGGRHRRSPQVAGRDTFGAGCAPWQCPETVRRRCLPSGGACRACHVPESCSPVS
jgi:hypothetical protein